MNSETLLTQAVAIWQSAERNYRDSLLQVGRLLHEYVVDYLMQRAGMSESECIRNGLTRVKALDACAGRLGTDRTTVGRLIRAAMVADLLADGGELGGIGFAGISQFSCMVRRKGCGRERHRTNRSPAAEVEEWEVRPEFAGSAPGLFRKAISENLGVRPIRSLVHACCAGLEGGMSFQYRSKVKPKRPKQQAETLERLETIAGKASPRDLAEILFKAVAKADDPKTVMMHLQQMTDQLPKKKKPSMAY